jgi:hypothetical protein
MMRMNKRQILFPIAVAFIMKSIAAIGGQPCRGIHLAEWKSSDRQVPVPSCTEVGISNAAVGSYVQAYSNKNFYLGPGQCIRSPNGQFIAIMEHDGDFAVLNTVTGAISWRSGTKGYREAGLLVQQDGHFVIYRAGGIKQRVDGAFDGDAEQCLFVSNVETLPMADYYLVIADDSTIALRKGLGPDQNLGTQWSSVATSSKLDNAQAGVGVDPSAYSVPRRGILVNHCVTPYTVCPISGAVPVGSSCSCNTKIGQITGIAND